MSFKTSKAELKEILHDIKKLMVVTEENEDILVEVIDNDIFGVSVVLTNEGTVRKLRELIDNTKLSFLKEYSKGDYEVFKKYYKDDIKDISFCTKDQKAVLKNLRKLYLQTVQLYFENRGDLMIYRKTVNSFISSNLKNKESLKDLKEVRGYLLNNYSYYDTVYNLGYNPEIGDNGFIKLDKLKLDMNGRMIKANSL